MARIFDPENGFFQWIGSLTDLLMLSAAWVVCSLPVVTVGPATAALYYGVVKCVRRKEPRALACFWGAFKGNLKTGALLSLMAVPLTALLLWGLWVLRMMAVQGGAGYQGVWMAYTLALVVPLGVIAWVFPLISRFESGLAQALSTAFRLSLGHLPSTAWAVLVGAILAEATVRFWYLPLWALTPGVWALLASFPMERVFRRYTPGAGEGGDEGPWYLK